MALIFLPYTFSVGNTIIASQHNSNFSTIYNDYNGNITDENISASAGITYTKLSLNNTIKSTDLLSSTIISTSNLPVGTTANKIVQLDSSAKLPAVDGSQLSGLGFGTRGTIEDQLTHQATTDLEINAYCSISAGNHGTIIGYSDSSATPTTIIQQAAQQAVTNGSVINITFSVKKNDYFKVVIGGNANSLIINTLTKGS